MKKNLVFLLLLCTGFSICRGNTDQRKTFIRKYKYIAIEEMNRTGIPASIKLAQAILESGCGCSHLSVRANNHFGIKCHNWSGPGVYKHDDRPDECFRKYKTAEESWVDHSEFLLSRPRYAPLFELHPTDYKGWAHGLKKAGYATDPQYAHRLIRIIEEEKLYEYDLQREHFRNPSDTYTENRRFQVIEVNGIPCVRVKQGDSFESIARHFNIPLKKLLVYNDKNETSIRAGMYVFLKKKKDKAAKGYNYHKVKPGENIYLISQMYGIRLSKLLRYNYIEPDVRLQAGELIALRKYTRFLMN